MIDVSTMLHGQVCQTYFDFATFFVHVLFGFVLNFVRVFLKQEEVDHVDEGCHSSPQ